MPYKFEYTKTKIKPQYDRRKKLSEEDKLLIKSLYGSISQRKLAKMFNVSRRLVCFIGNPKSYEDNLKARELRGGWKCYYNKDKHKETMKEHRRYKQKLSKENKLELNQMPSIIIKNQMP